MILSKVVIIGAGLIGSSIGRGLEAHVGSIHYIDKDQGSDADFEAAALIVIATPVLAIHDVLKRIQPYLVDTTMIMDVGSTKAFVLEQAQVILGKYYCNFVGCHPIAGKAESGFAAGEADLFKDKPVILTPTADTAVLAINTVRQVWQTLGANLTEMTAIDHDYAFARYSHLANLLSFILQKQAQVEPQIPQELLPPSFKEMTRLAASSPVMWRDICLTNKAAVLEALEQFEADLTDLKAAIAANKGDQLLTFFKNN